MKLTDKLVKKFGADKLLHFAFGGWLGSMCCFIGLRGAFAGVAVVYLLSLIKEVFFDKQFDWGDIIAGECGAALAGIVYLLSLYIV